jgi:cell division protease FtsH
LNQFYRNLALWMIIALAMVFLFNTFKTQKVEYEEIPFSEFVASVDSGLVQEVTIKGQEIHGKYGEASGKTKKEFHTYAPDDPDLVKNLRSKDVRITAKPIDDNPWYMTLLISWLPMLLLIGVWIFFMRQMQAGGGKAMSFGKSRAKLLTETTAKVTFDDVAGIEEAKEELQEIIAFLKDPKKFTRLGGRIPKGVLLVGAPGTGKTLLARAIAGEAGVPFFSISGSDFVEMFVGVGAARVRDLFIQGKKSAPCIIFIDEIDAVGRHRGAGLGGGHDEREQTLNQLLVEMDGFEANEGLILISATNRPDVLDPALLRPGRYDRQVVVPKPDVKGREQILGVHTKKIPLGEDVNLEILAKGTPGFTGADLANLCNEAALHAASVGFNNVTMECFEMAKDKVMMGRERRSMIIPEEEKRSTAYHEAGHAIVATLIPGADPIHKVSIIPRGMALGVTQQLPIDERHTYSKDYLKDNITILMGGRVAEELVRGELTTGAGNDIERSTYIARKMVCEWGMSEKLGPVTFGQKQEAIFLGREFGRHQDYSESTARDIDNEVKVIVLFCYDRAKQLLKTNIHVLHKVANTLLEKEVVDGAEIKRIIEDLVVPPGGEPPTAEAGSPA